MRKCPLCDGQKLAWDSYQVTTIPPTGSTVPAPKLILCCEECSQTVESVCLDDVAVFLTEARWKMA